jgi:phosphatidylserine/phosphatidylglycerophosphate/cardiolipin synthase-like enzyme
LPWPITLEHSIDLQYYIFQNDATEVAGAALLAAADRGVRVRMLIGRCQPEGRRTNARH